MILAAVKLISRLPNYLSPSTIRLNGELNGSWNMVWTFMLTRWFQQKG